MMESFYKAIEDAQHVIWDWNGTILDDLNHTVETINDTLKNHLTEPLSLQKHLELFCFPISKYYADLGLDITEDEFLKLCQQFIASYKQGLQKCKPHPWALQSIEDISKTHGRQSILSAMDQNSLNELTEHYQLTGYFKNIYGIKDQAGASKLERGHELFKQLSVSPENLVFIGDTEHDYEVATQLGIQQIFLVSHGHYGLERLRKVTKNVLLTKNH